MARGDTTVVKRLVYEYLRINTQGSYGTYKSNQRYPSGYVDDEIYSADIEITQLMLKNSQNHLLAEIYETAAVTSGTAIPNGWVIISVHASSVKLTELDEDTYERIDEGGIYNDATYNKYYMAKDGVIKAIVGGSLTVKYIDLDRTTSLRTPSGFEGAVAFLAASTALMNRNDNPTQSEYLWNRYKDFMSAHNIPVNPRQIDIEKP